MHRTRPGSERLPTRRNHPLILVLLLAAFAAAPVHAGELPPPLAAFEAEYRVVRAGLTLGKSTQRLSPEGSGWRYETISSARGVGRLFVSGEAIERTHLEANTDTLRPRMYYQRIPGEEGDARVRFDWHGNKAHVHNPDGRLEVDITPGMYDPHSALLILMISLAREGELPSLEIIDDEGEIEVLGFTRLAEESVEVPFGRYDTVKVKLVREDSDRETIAWFAPALNWLPIRLEQHRRGRLVARLELVVLDGEQPANTGDVLQRRPGR